MAYDDELEQSPEQEHEGQIYDRKTGEWVTERQMKHRRHQRQVKTAEKIGAEVGKGMGFVASETFDAAEHVAKAAAKLERRREAFDTREELRREQEGDGAE